MPTLKQQLNKKDRIRKEAAHISTREGRFCNNHKRENAAMLEEAAAMLEETGTGLEVAAARTEAALTHAKRPQL